MIESSFSVHVPATTANLGPGFDCLGLALDLWNIVTFTLSDSSLTIEIKGEGEDTLPVDKSNLIFRAANHLANAAGLALPDNFHIACSNKIPIGSGLGSSACAVISGLIGARELLGIKFSDSDLLQIAAQMEGHADNAGACLLGGLILVQNNKDQFNFLHLDIDPVKTVIAVPDYSIPTSKAREVLPQKIALHDAVYNISHTASLIQIFQTGNYESLNDAMSDTLHQNYRLPILPGAEAAMHAARQADAYGTCLSGAGPGVIAFTSGEKAESVGNAMKAAYDESSIKSKIFNLDCPAKGSFVD